MSLDLKVKKKRKGIWERWPAAWKRVLVFSVEHKEFHKTPISDKATVTMIEQDEKARPLRNHIWTVFISWGAAARAATNWVD